MNQISNLVEVVVAVVVAVIPFIIKQIEEWLENNQTSKTIVSILPTIAKDAVVITEKLGVEEELTGNDKNLKAVQFVSEALKNLGFTDVDKQITENAVESAYAELKKSGTLSVYKPDDKQEAQQAEKNKQEQPQVEQAKQATDEQ
ncbi:MAG: holin (endogenous virus) [Lactobacillus phage ViSo-2018a]|uniref:Holin n=1 Tax=Lactobacillus phage ViSo-2018a TaxID=2267607 RepID=A0A3G6JL34_9CAUD|nr:MAG: holin [Lactobacillus phage ViSo-2018a]AZA17350.1 MAG: hypothetical protein DQL93_0855 [Lactobacillus phage ViSo-2018a]